MIYILQESTSNQWFMQHYANLVNGFLPILGCKRRLVKNKNRYSNNTVYHAYHSIRVNK